MSVIKLDNKKIIEINAAHLDQLKKAASQAPLRRSRICLHPDNNDKVHEMVIAFCRDSYIPPHRHTGKSESFHIIEGALQVIFFDDAGAVSSRLNMAPPGSKQTFFYRLNCNQYHTAVMLTDYVIIHETTTGPFIKDQSEFAPWAPAADDVNAVKAFMDRIIE